MVMLMRNLFWDDLNKKDKIINIACIIFAILMFFIVRLFFYVILGYIIIMFLVKYLFYFNEIDKLKCDIKRKKKNGNTK